MRVVKYVAIAVLAAATSFSATLLHDYQFNGNLNDSLGGPTLIGLGGTVVSGQYQFGANQGLSLSNGLTSGGNYSVVLDFSFETLSGFRRVMEFKNLGSDFGLYTLGSNLTFYTGGTGSTVLAPNTMTQLVLTRDGTSGTVAGYIGGVAQFSFTDTSERGTFSGPNNIMHFFRDDSNGEASAGVAERIRIYDGALTAGEVATLDSAPIPEPSTFAMFGLAGLAAAFAARRRR